MPKVAKVEGEPTPVDQEAQLNQIASMLGDPGKKPDEITAIEPEPKPADKPEVKKPEVEKPKVEESKAPKKLEPEADLVEKLKVDEPTLQQQLTERDVKIDELRKQIQDMATSGVFQVEEPEPAPPEREPVELEPTIMKAEAEKAPIGDYIEFVSDEEFELALSSPKELNKMLTKVYNRGVERTYETMPGIIDKRANSIAYTNSLVSEFYAQNADLRDYKPFVGFMTQKISSRHPDWKINKILEVLAEETRKSLNMVAAAQKPPEAKNAASIAGLPPSPNAVRAPADTKPKTPEEKQKADIEGMITQFAS